MLFNRIKHIIFLSIIILSVSCRKDNDLENNYQILQPQPGEQLLGGKTTIFDHSVNAFGFQIPNLKQKQRLDFFVGNSLFNKNWVSAPASTTARDGLGPLFNSRACSACHFKDGRGRPPVSPKDLATGILLRLSIGNDPITGPIPDPNYGGQLQDRSIPGVPTEATLGITYQKITGKYPDGTPYELRKPTYTVENLTQGNLQATHFSPRIAPQMIGLGLLDAIPEQDILKNVDENDSNNDGISGKANFVTDIINGGLSLGKYGWKCNQPTIKQQVAAAFSGDMGLTSSLFPEENKPPSHKNIDIPNGGTPEVDDKALENVTLYSSVLAVPVRRNWKNQDVLKGKQLFSKINCIGCHIDNFTTSEQYPITALRNQNIKPYTDLLLHDMGEELSDNSPDFLATGKEWRTQPLWGIGLIETVNRHTFLLHDGRARNIEEAILWHGGEAEKSKNEFMKLSKQERNQLLTFINSL